MVGGASARTADSGGGGEGTSAAAAEAANNSCGDGGESDNGGRTAELPVPMPNPGHQGCLLHMAYNKAWYLALAQYEVGRSRTEFRHHGYGEWKTAASMVAVASHVRRTLTRESWQWRQLKRIAFEWFSLQDCGAYIKMGNLENDPPHAEPSVLGVRLVRPMRRTKIWMPRRPLLEGAWPKRPGECEWSRTVLEAADESTWEEENDNRVCTRAPHEYE